MKNLLGLTLVIIFGSYLNLFAAAGPQPEGGGAYGCMLYNCTLTGNSASSGGGASGSTLYNCVLTGNSAQYVGGGAVWSTLYNCTLTDNSSTYLGGGAFGGGAFDCTLYNCTVTGNSATGYGGGAFGGTLYNCIVYYNTAPNGPNYFTGEIPDWVQQPTTKLHHSCTTPLPTNGVGNITGPPLFMDMPVGDFRLREESPCIDAGTNLLGMSFTRWAGDYDPETGEPVMVVTHYAHDATDILGNTRFIDGNFDGTVAWDIGAYEFNSFTPPRFSIAPQLTSDGWKLNITGAANQWARLQRSSDLKNWEDIWPDVYMGAEGVRQVNVENTGGATFYRMVVP